MTHAPDAPAPTVPPPSPLDWRYVVRTFGKVLIATGLLLGGFAAYQLWGTGIEARRSQNQLEDEFEELLASTAPTTSSTSPASTGSTAAPPAPPESSVPASTVPAPVPTAVPPPIAPIAEGDPIARLEIPAIGVDVVVVAGVSVEDLRRGPGHYPSTPLPGQLGNAAIAGHRTTYGQPFHDVDDLEAGDEIVVTTLAGRFVYGVTGTEIVEPTDTDVIETTDPDIAELTLTSCHPKWSAERRIIVRSLLLGDQSAAVTPATGYADDAPPVPTIAPTPTATAATATTDTASPTETAPSTVSAPASTTATQTTVAASAGSPPHADAFAAGWFHDRSAIPQVLLWASIVAAIAVGANLLSRRSRSYVIGVAAAIVPFVVALYFFYQNVNRLLPPSL